MLPAHPRRRVEEARHHRSRRDELKALAVGEPALLTRAQMDEVIKKFKGYGRAAALGAVTSMPRTTTSSAERDDGGLHRPASIPATSR
jgi:hypothetical protein